MQTAHTPFRQAQTNSAHTSTCSTPFSRPKNTWSRKVKYLLSDSDENVWIAYDEGVQIIRKQLFTKNILPSTDSFAGQSTTINDSTFLLATKNSIYKVLITEDEIT